MQKNCAVYGEGAVTDRTCQNWFVKFHAGDFSLDDAPQSGWPVEVDSSKIKTLTEKNQCYTTWEIADILKISKSIVIGENEKCIFYGKNQMEFVGNWIFWFFYESRIQIIFSYVYLER